MSEVRLNVIDAKDAIHGTVHGSIGDAVIASLSAEPETIDELEAALDRFNKRQQQQAPFASFVTGEDTNPWDAGVIIVNLAARIIAVESSYSDPQAQGEVNYHDGSGATDVWLSYRLPSDWLFLSSVLEYESLRDERLAERMADPRRDIRQVLYGRPLIEFIVSECLAESEKLGDRSELDSSEEAERSAELDGHPNRDSNRVQDGGSGQDSHTELDRRRELDDHMSFVTQPELDSQPDLDGDPELDGFGPDYVLLQSLHARWLMTPRADLGDRTPREVILEKQDFIESDIQSREVQWSFLNEGPPPLSRESHAYLFAGFGFHEYVIYYYLVRYLLEQCWARVRQDRPDAISDSPMPWRTGIASEPTEVGSAPLTEPALQVEESAALLEWLEEIKQAWLNEPSEEYDGRIPSAMIESERRRIPLVISPKDMIIDENCDLCRMLGDETSDLFGPGFWHLDGCNMDHLFEFSTYETREEWEAEEQRRREFNEEFERQWAAEHPTTDHDTQDVREGAIKDGEIED